MKRWPMNTMAKTFICPGLVIRMPAVRGTRAYRIDYCYTGCCDVTDLKTGKQRMLTIDCIRDVGVLIGKGYKQKV